MPEFFEEAGGLNWNIIKPKLKKTELNPKKDDPNQYVNTYNLMKHKISDCIRINWIGWVHKDDPDLVKDCVHINEYTLKSRSIILITYFEESNGKPDINNVGFTIDKKGLATIDYMGNRYNTIDIIIPNKYYTESMVDGIFYHNSKPSKVKDKINAPLYRRIKNSYSSSTGDLKKDYLMGVRSPSYLVTEGKQYSFGVELETIKGYLPPYLDKYLNYDAVHDGSLRGPNGEDPQGGEYVSGVLRGDTGFLQLKRLCNELTRRCLMDLRCGMHAHFGGINFNKENLVLIYKVYFLLEDQLFSMLPASRSKNKYCRKLPLLDKCFIEFNTNDSYEYNLQIEEAYLQLLAFVGEYNLPSFKNNKKTNHPWGNKCGYKHESSRYCWLNFVPAIYNTRDNWKIKTLEIRNHSATTNYRKVKNWVLIHMGILWYIENHRKEALENKQFDLFNIIQRAYPKNSSIITAYILERQKLFELSNEKRQLEVESSDLVEINEDENLTYKTV